MTTCGHCGYPMVGHASANGQGFDVDGELTYQPADTEEQPLTSGPMRAGALPPDPEADIPAGQGAASLFIAPDGHARLAAWFKRGDGHAMHLLSDPGPDATAAEAAMWDHLAATLPTVTD